MNTALAIIQAAVSDGLSVDLLPNGNLEVVGKPEVIKRWTPRSRQHKPAIVEVLRKIEIPLPSWCSAGCERYTRLDLPGRSPIRSDDLPRRPTRQSAAVLRPHPARAGGGGRPSWREANQRDFRRILSASGKDFLIWPKTSKFTTATRRKYHGGYSGIDLAIIVALR